MNTSEETQQVDPCNFEDAAWIVPSLSGKPDGAIPKGKDIPQDATESQINYHLQHNQMDLDKESLGTIKHFVSTCYPNEIASDLAIKHQQPLLSYDAINRICIGLLYDQDQTGEDLNSPKPINELFTAYPELTTFDKKVLNLQSNTAVLLPKIENFLTEEEALFLGDKSILKHCYSQYKEHLNAAYFSEHFYQNTKRAIDLSNILQNLLISPKFTSYNAKYPNQSYSVGDRITTQNLLMPVSNSQNHYPTISESLLLALLPGYLNNNPYSVQYSALVRRILIHESGQDLVDSGYLTSVLAIFFSKADLVVEDIKTTNIVTNPVFLSIIHHLMYHHATMTAILQYPELRARNTNKHSTVGDYLHFQMYLALSLLLTPINPAKELLALTTNPNCTQSIYLDLATLVTKEIINTTLVSKATLDSYLTSIFTSSISSEKILESDLFMSRYNLFNNLHIPKRAFSIGERGIFAVNCAFLTDMPALQEYLVTQAPQQSTEQTQSECSIAMDMLHRIQQDRDSAGGNNLGDENCTQFQAVSNLEYLNNLFIKNTSTLEAYGATTNSFDISVSPVLLDKYQGTGFPNHLVLLHCKEGTGYTVPMLVIMDEYSLVHTLVPSTSNMVNTLLQLYRTEPNPRLSTGGQFFTEFKQLLNTTGMGEKFLTSIISINFQSKNKTKYTVADLKSITDIEDADTLVLAIHKLLSRSLDYSKLRRMGKETSISRQRISTSRDLVLCVNTTHSFITQLNRVHLGNYFAGHTDQDELNPDYYFSDYILVNVEVPKI